jgi:plastocyanin
MDLDIKGGSAATGPFTTPGVYVLSCAIHHSMNLTVVVQ